ncbi:MAG TPA: YihY/virulence factor BrkB family protein [Beijerinckiaceae bacterium]|jgi:membrane protein
MSISALTGPSASRPARRTSPLWTFLLGLVVVRLAGTKERTPAVERVPAAERASATDTRDKTPEAEGKGGHTGREAEEKAVTEPDRGRAAESPWQIPAKGWKDILWRTYEQMNQDRILAVAGGVTYFGLLALFPAVTAMVSIYGLFADAVTINQHLAGLSGLLPDGALQIVGDQVKRITENGSTALGIAFFSGLGLALWSANAGVKALFDALSVAYGEQEKRGFIKLNLLSLSFTLGAIIFILMALGAIVVIPVVLKFVGLGAIAEWVLWAARWPVLFAGVVFALAVLYRYGPSRDNPQWQWITPGSVLAATVWIVGSMLFSWYVANFGNYNETYGSLGAVIGFMTWLWLSVTIILVGAELNAEIEHQTVKDTTAGGPQPLGARGAHMADTVGEAKA